MNTQIKEDRRMIAYFWLMRGDLERYSRWEQCKEDFPTVLEAWNNYQASIERLNQIVRAFPQEIE